MALLAQMRVTRSEPLSPAPLRTVSGGRLSRIGRGDDERIVPSIGAVQVRNRLGLTPEYSLLTRV
jgi:hypothetical protein